MLETQSNFNLKTAQKDIPFKDRLVSKNCPVPNTQKLSNL
jgi:hypothetical protein